MKAGVVFNDKYNVPYRRGRKEGRKGKNSLANDIEEKGIVKDVKVGWRKDSIEISIGISHKD